MQENGIRVIPYELNQRFPHKKREATPTFGLGNFKYEAYILETNQDFKQNFFV